MSTQNEQPSNMLTHAEVIELAQANGGRFLHSEGAWRILGQNKQPLTLFNMTSWVSLSDACAAFLRARNIPLSRARWEADRGKLSPPGSRIFTYPSHDDLHRKYTA